MGGHEERKLGNATYLNRAATARWCSRPVLPGGRRRAFLVRNGALFGITDVARELALEDAGNDATGAHASFTQRELGLPVRDTRLSVVFDARGRIALVSGSFVPWTGPGRARRGAHAHRGDREARDDLATRYPKKRARGPRPTPPPELVLDPRGAFAFVLE